MHLWITVLAIFIRFDLVTSCAKHREVKTPHGSPVLLTNSSRPFFISYRASYFGHRFHTPPPKKKLKQIAFNSQEICNKIDKCMKSGNETYLELLVRSTGEPCGVLTSLCFAQLVTRSNLIKMARTVIQRWIVVCCLIIYRV
jgi:hypothetical protein